MAGCSDELCLPCSSDKRQERGVMYPAEDHSLGTFDYCHVRVGRTSTTITTCQIKSRIPYCALELNLKSQDSTYHRHTTRHLLAKPSALRHTKQHHPSRPKRLKVPLRKHKFSGVALIPSSAHYVRLYLQVATRIWAVQPVQYLGNMCKEDI